MPTPTRNVLDHFEIFLFLIPCMILAMPKNNNPKANIVTKKIAVISGNAITAIPNPIVIAPNAIFPIREVFVRFERAPTTTLSIPATKSENESNAIKVVIPIPGSVIIARDKTMAIIPSTI